MYIYIFSYGKKEDLAIAVASKNTKEAGPPPRILVKDLKVKVEAGERWAILGPNGAGKSTVAQTLLQRWEPWISVSMGLQVTCFIVYIFGFH